MGKIIRNGIEYCGTSDTADNIIYDNTDSGLAATNTQTAIDELSEKVKSGGNIEYLTQVQYDALPDDKLTNGVEYRITDAGTMAGAENVGYDNSKSSIEAVNVQDAIDGLSGNLSIVSNDLSGLMNIFYKPLTLKNTNIDTAMLTGFYHLPTISNYNNTGTFPTELSGNQFLMIIHSAPQAHGIQLAIGFGSNKIAIRNMPFDANGNGKWSAWRYI